MIFNQLFDNKSSTYTYIIASGKGREALIIDPVIENTNEYLKVLDNQFFNEEYVKKLSYDREILNIKDRLTILENILDEHGNGDINNSHAETYKNYLLNLGVKEKDINETLSHSAVSNFYSIIEDTIKGDSIETAIAMFGIIEDRYTEISATIATSLVNNNWLSEDQLTHYKTHKELDIYHAELFYKLVRPKWVEETSRENIIKGIKLGNAIIFDMFNNLLEVD